MKRILLILLLLACTLPPPPADGAEVNGRTQLAFSAAIQAVLGASGAAGGTSSFGFGNGTDACGSDNDSAALQASLYSGVTFTYGGTTGTLTKLCAYVVASASNDDSFRLAVYSNDETPALVAQGSAAITVPTGTGTAWRCHTSFTDADGTPITPTITNGVVYKLAYATLGAYAAVRYTTGSSGDMKYVGSTNYTTGFPATFNPSTASSRKRCIWAEVTY